MTDQVLDILKLALLGLLYLFFARVLWAVWSEVRSPDARSAGDVVQSAGSNHAAAPIPAPFGNPLRNRHAPPTKLVVIEPKARKGTSFPIEGVVGIGRENDNTIRIEDDAFISGYHARVWLSDDRVLVEDRGSKNGSFLNGRPVEAKLSVKVGDRIQVGYTVLEAQA